MVGSSEEEIAVRRKSTNPTFPPLETKRLHLRDICVSDARFLLKLWGDPDVTEFMIVDPPITKQRQALLNILLLRR